MLALEIFLGVMLFVLGSVFASFFGVIICRVPEGGSIVSPKSHCANCGHVLKWYENIPILSFIILRGKCSKCKTKIGAFSFLYELIGGVSLLLSYLAFGLSFETVFIVLIVLILLLIAGYDYATQTILDVFWIVFLGFAVGLFVYRIAVLKADFLPYLIGAGVGGAFFGAVKGISYLVTKTTCLGGGDVIVMAIAGLILGWMNLLFAILVASLAGLLIEGALMALKKKTRESHIPFCPYLVFGIFVALLYGTPILESIINSVM